MPSLLRIFALLLIAIGFTDAAVKFAHSTMYDIYDFQSVTKIPLEDCDEGCLIFASTFGDARTDAYLANLFIDDPVLGRQTSIVELALQFQPGTSRKVAYDIPVPAKYSLLNHNALAALGGDITVWVIDRKTAHGIDYEIYDAAKMDRIPSVPNAVLTIMSVAPFAVYADRGEVNAYAARQVGFDAAFEKSDDKCEAVFETPANSLFDGFKFYVNAPIISFVFTHKTKVAVRSDFNYLGLRQLSNSGFITSPGYHGCANVDDSQAYRSKLYHPSDQIDLHGEPDFYQVDFDVKSDLAGGQEIVLTDLTGVSTKITKTGRLRTKVTMPKTQIASVSYKDITAPESFHISYVVKVVELGPTPPAPKTTTTEPANGNQPTTTTAKTMTTSAVGAATGIAAFVVVCTKLLALRDHLKNN